MHIVSLVFVNSSRRSHDEGTVNFMRSDMLSQRAIPELKMTSANAPEKALRGLLNLPSPDVLINLRCHLGL